MRKYLFISLVLSLFIYSPAEPIEATPVAIDTYSLNLSLRVPQVFSNTSSKGYRKYKLQRIKGNMYIIWMSNGSVNIEFDNLVNNNFKVGGRNVTYQGIEGCNVIFSRFNWIGDNKTDLFRTPCLSFYLELEPSYAIGGNNEDNSFYLMMSGKGSSVYKPKYKSRIATFISGFASGTQGCGCTAYEHKSPTRKASAFGPTEIPEDVVATFGQWRARWQQRQTL